MVIVAAWTLVRCIFVNLTLRCKRPINQAYPKQLLTLGDHLRTVRLDRGLSQPQMAKLLKVTTDTVTGWELNRYEPQARLAKEIIKFLSYLPFQEQNCSIGRQLYLARLVLGHSQDQAALKMGCDESNLRCIELGKRVPQPKTLRRIESYLLCAKEKLNLVTQQS